MANSTICSMQHNMQVNHSSINPSNISITYTGSCYNEEQGIEDFKIGEFYFVKIQNNLQMTTDYQIVR